MTSAFGRLCNATFNRKAFKTKNLDKVAAVFASQEAQLRKHHSDRMSGENNPSYGLYGKLHPTNKTSKSGSRNPNYGKKASDLCKSRASESNKNMVLARDIRDDSIKKVTRDEFQTSSYLVGITKGRSTSNKGTVSCLNLITGRYERVSTELFESSDEHVSPGSKEAKEFKRKQIEI
jgi:hypothetical protein